MSRCRPTAVRRCVVAALVSLALFLILVSVGGDSPPAYAGTANGSFVVNATVFSGCTLAASDMTFPGYTTGQSQIVTASSTIRVFCSSATAGRPVPVKVRVRGAAPKAFQMSSGAGTLNYQLCWDVGCAQVIDKVPDKDVLLDKVAYDVPTYGEIFANQNVAPGAYSQTVTVSVQY